MMIRPVENWHCEAERIRRTQELHQRRLKSIETETSRRLKEIKDPSKRLTKTAPRVQSDWVSRDPADHRRTYAHIRGGRAGVDAQRTVEAARADRALQQRLAAIEAGVPDAHAHKVERRVGGRPSEVQARLEAGRAKHVAPGERARRAERARIAEDNLRHQRALRQAKPKFASDSTIRTLRGEPKPAARPRSAASGSDLFASNFDSSRRY